MDLIVECSLPLPTPHTHKKKNLSYDKVIPLLDIYPNEMKTFIAQKLFIRMFINFINNRQKLEIVYVFISKRVN